jgi:hypothetical protein
LNNIALDVLHQIPHQLIATDRAIVHLIHDQGIVQLPLARYFLYKSWEVSIILSGSCRLWVFEHKVVIEYRFHSTILPDGILVFLNNLEQ